MSGDFQGEVTPSQAWDGLLKERNAQLLDVRTEEERAFVGLPDLSALGREVIAVPWQTYPRMEENSTFLDQVAAKGLRKGDPVYVLCRSGVRSLKAAYRLAEAGFATWNVIDGFEGPLDDEGHRGGVGGWKAQSLPWRQR